MIERVQAIVLRISPYSETSHIVSWLTPDRGRLTTLVKGALRPRSAFLGQYDLFYTCELLYYGRDRDGLHIAKDCHPVQTRTALRTRWEAAACASYTCRLAALLSYSGAHQGDLYEPLERVLDLLVTLDTPRPALLFWFEWRALEALGHLPRINACAECGGEVARGGDFAYAPVRAGIVCGRCADGARPSGAVRTGPDTLAILRALHTDRDGRDAARIVFTAKQALAFPVLFDTFFASFAETVTANRSLALDAVAIRCGQ